MAESEAHYPHLPPHPALGPWRPMNFITVAGWFAQHHEAGDAAIAFSGYLRHDPETQEFLGLLIDGLKGPAFIEGEMSEDELMFAKYNYYSSIFNPPSRYTLSSPDGQNWHRHYRLRGGQTTGLVECVTTLVEPNAFGIEFYENSSLEGMHYNAHHQQPTNLKEDYGIE